MSRIKGLPTVFVITMLIVASCGRKEPGVSPEQSLPAVKGTAFVTVKSRQLEETFEASGTVRSRTAAVVSPRIPGVITAMNAREGVRVKKGETLARLDARENQANAAAAAGAVEDARRALDESKARKTLADTQFDRYQKLFKADAVSRQEFEIKDTEKELARQGVARAEARLGQAWEQEKAAGAFADYTKIIAPISGIVTARHADLGATVFPGQPVFTLEDEGGYQLEVAIPESLASRVSAGTAANVTLDSVAVTFAGKITETVPAADSLSRTFTAKIPLTQKGLKSGMFGRAVMGLGSKVSGIWLPKAALVERGSLVFVWIITGDNIAKMRLVKAGKTVGEQIEILSGLTEGERVITTGSEKISEGVKVE